MFVFRVLRRQQSEDHFDRFVVNRAIVHFIFQGGEGAYRPGQALESAMGDGGDAPAGAALLVAFVGVSRAARKVI